MTNKIEVLAPCGTLDSFYAAVNAGCDACYLAGTMFGARAYAGNFDPETLLRVIRYAHMHSVKVYLTINTLLKNSEFSQLYEFLFPLYQNGLDAVIIQDLGVLSFVKREFPDLSIHCSTQMNICSSYGAAYAKNCGASRIVTARELSLKEIQNIKETVDIEVETFVHGAMCFCYSGRCLLSSMAGGRSGNRGRCAQPCRKQYNGKYEMSMKDMCALKYVPALIEAGVDSLKIEGRMKNEYYTAACVEAYRTMVCDYYDGNFSEEKAEAYQKRLLDIFNRGGFTEGYFFMRNDSSMRDIYHPGNQGLKVGNVEQVSDGGVCFTALEPIYKQDVFSIRTKDKEEVEFTSGISADSGESVFLRVPNGRKIKKNDEIFRTKCLKLLNEIDEDLIKKERKIPVDMHVILAVGKPAELTLSMTCFGEKIESRTTGETVGAAENQPITKDVVLEKITKLGNTDLKPERIEIELENGAFLPVSAINRLRRRALEELEEKCAERFRRTGFMKSQEEINEILRIFPYHKKGEKKFRISLQNKEQAEALLDCIKTGIHVDAVYLEAMNMTEDVYFSLADKFRSLGTKIFLNLPYIFREDGKLNDDEISRLILATDGFLIRNIDMFQYMLAHPEISDQKEWVLAASLYAYNDHAVRHFSDVAKQHTARLVFDLPRELNQRELSELSYPDEETDIEMCVYGKEALMITAQCLSGGKERTLEDDRKNRFSCFSNCRMCYNIIYNGLPLSLHNALDRFAKIRLDFTNESDEELKETVTGFYHSFFRGRPYQPAAYTTGHYNRGIQ